MRFNRWVTVCLGWRTEANLARVGAGFPRSKFWGEKVFLVQGWCPKACKWDDSAQMNALQVIQNK